MHDGEVQRARPAHRPADDAPTRWVRADTEPRDHVWHHVFSEVIGRVSSASVDAFGVVVKRAPRVHKDEYWRVAAVPGRHLVDRSRRVAGPPPIGGRVELAADPHYPR